MKKFLIASIAGLSMMVSACGPNVQQPMQQTAQACVDPQGNPADCVQGVAQQGGSFIQEHPLATAAIVGGGAYMLGKRNANRRNGYAYGYHQPRTVVRRTVYRNVYRAPAVSSYRSYSRPSYVTRTTTYRRR